MEGQIVIEAALDQVGEGCGCARSLAYVELDFDRAAVGGETHHISLGWVEFQCWLGDTLCALRYGRLCCLSICRRWCADTGLTFSEDRPFWGWMGVPADVPAPVVELPQAVSTSPKAVVAEHVQQSARSARAVKHRGSIVARLLDLRRIRAFLKHPSAILNNGGSLDARRVTPLAHARNTLAR